MKYVLRIKAVSQCFGIRRANVIYLEMKDRVFDLTSQDHPMASFKGITIKGNSVSVLDTTNELKIGEDVFFYKNSNVSTQTGEVVETKAMGVMMLPLDIEMLDYYQNAINNGERFDTWNGEMEYILGMMYELDQNNDLEAEEWYNKALEKGFKFKLLK